MFAPKDNNDNLVLTCHINTMAAKWSAVEDMMPRDRLSEENSRSSGRAYNTAGSGQESGARMLCSQIMTRDVSVVARTATLREVAMLMLQQDTGVIPVVAPMDQEMSASTSVNLGRLLGLVTDRDIALRAVAAGLDAELTTAEQIMTTELYTVAPDTRVVTVMRLMGDKQVRRVPVVDADGVLCGIISMADIALQIEDDRELAEALEDISSGASFWNNRTP